MWIKSENSESNKPAAVSENAGGVIVRKDFVHVEAAENAPEHWKYREWQMSKEQYDVYQQMQSDQADIEDALIELAEIIAGG